VIFDEGGVYLKNEGEDKVITPHIENLIFDNNDQSLHPSIVRNTRLTFKEFSIKGIFIFSDNKISC
jgi:hypothetical protein